MWRAVDGFLAPYPFLTIAILGPNPPREDPNASPSIVTALIKGFDGIEWQTGLVDAYRMRRRRNRLLSLRERIWSDPSLR